jgi:hypothetical protein
MQKVCHSIDVLDAEAGWAEMRSGTAQASLSLKHCASYYDVLLGHDKLKNCALLADTRSDVCKAM